MNSRKEKSRQLWENIDWDSAFSNKPAVVNATLNSLTNEFDVARKTRPHSKFDYMSSRTSTTSRSTSQQGWGEAPNAASVWSFEETEAVPTDKFSSKSATATFRLNSEVDDDPQFSEVIDYTAFRQQEVIPDFDDIIVEEDENEGRSFRDPLPNIPINKVKSSYDSIEQYLYTHFELMRQDFLIPLQKAIKAYKADYDLVKDKEDISLSMEGLSAQRPYRLYEHVHLNAIVFGSRQPLYRISFRLPYYVRVNWTQSKRLLPGSLVLLSKDNFDQDLKIATVVNREDEPMRGPSRFEYMIDIYLERDNEQQPLGFGDPLSLEETSYVMIEATDGYFEAYRHVLNVFKKIKPGDLPFSQYLVNLSNDVMVPHYAARRRIYDINVNKRSQYERWPVDITQEWPFYNIGMDRTQMDALKTILSHNLSIVQGPPGTGKTFVGTYAMRVLLNNFDGSIGPIICICQTNHALDQFLEHILSHCDEIVRVGGRSKSELLKEHTMYELKKTHERPRGIGRLYRSRDEITKQIRETLVELYEEPCVDIDFVASINALRPRQIEALKRVGEREKGTSEIREHESFDTVGNDSDDDWVISSVEPTPSKVKPTKSFKNKRNKKNTINNDWLGGNPNHISENKQKQTNPIEYWLRDAIEYVDNQRNMSTIAERLKQTILEQDKGLIYDDIIDEKEIIEEEELQDVVRGYQGDDTDSNEYKDDFIQIGKAYIRQTEVAIGERPERKIINYQKVKPMSMLESGNFNIFGNTVNESELDESITNISLERWMKEDDVSLWPLPARLKAHKVWIDQRNMALELKLNNLMQRYLGLSQEIRKVMAAHEAKICRQHRVVGMTSTAAAKYHDLLAEIRPKVMVVEEAAEMLESHIISALTNSLEHLILIGDHQQLRPSTAVHELAENHHLSVSLFERLVINKFPFTRLSHQRRMRPEIRTLINPIYKDPPLKDHPQVLSYPPIRGMDQSLFFLAHNEEETTISESASKVNEHEAKFTAKLCVYLMLQGYQAEDITIITMYSGQKSLIKRSLRDERRPDIDLDLIHVSSVDGYQGEENKIIILSLVRSNSNGQIGFLRTANRVCVALSRAQHGLYILGNARLLCERSDLWNEIVANLEDQPEHMIGTKLVLKCQKHQRKTELQWPVDFSEVPEGGCSEMCDEILPCGHKCNLKCHPYDHSEYRCTVRCDKVLECNHVCTRRCCDPCTPCQAKMSVRLLCGHIWTEECYQIRKIALSPEGHHCPTCGASLKSK
ncbi:RNA helicase [Mycotypha africana]|uniref:RNA helicase n=1 Tax=Mycotypha africana TaxID=64632 RepID=UPI00230155E2|nr:RNA helicase [Mycotypha africana]KAI8977492.1 RNA helicase [Mycotypha africana]